jgi:Tfp pilus assembly protein PilO
MKDLGNKIIAQAHILLLLYGLWVGYGLYEEHLVQLEQVQASGASLDSDIDQAKRKVKEIQEFLKKSDEYKVRVEEVARNIEAVQKQLPADTNDTHILTFLQNEINSLNLKDAQFVPGKEDKSTYFISKDYTLSAKGTFLQFLIFLERISNADRIYNIKSLKLTSPNENQKGRFHIIESRGVIQAYRFNPDFKVERGF